jgi:hypothetical protein
LRNYVRAIHENSLGLSYLVTLTPLAYLAMMPVAVVAVTFIAALDPEELDH